MATPLDKLRSEPVHATAVRLQERVEARFRGRGLCHVAAALVSLVEQVTASPAIHKTRLHKARLASRALIIVVAVASALVFVVAVRDAVRDGPDQGFEWLPLIEAGVNDLVFAAIAIWFLLSIPERLERRNALDLLHQMRSLAHIVDMHQLTKDPERLRESFQPTPKSADPMGLDPEQLEHYLDYCSELLSLIGKTAALLAEESQDGIVLDTVGGVETLTSGLSGELWQKITILNDARRELSRRPESPSA